MKPVLFFCCFSLFAFTTKAQHVTILPGGITPNNNSSLPRLAYEAILALPSPQGGDTAYDITFNCLRLYNGSKWVRLISDQDMNMPAVTGWKEGGNGEDRGTNIGTDAAGNVYLSGNFSNTVDFGGISLTSSGGTDVFVAKYSQAGALVWVKKGGGIVGDTPSDMAVDADGNVIIAGNFNYPITFDNYIINPAGYFDIFLAKYNTNGELQWMKKEGGSDTESITGLTFDNDGNIFMTGYFYETSPFSGGAIISAGKKDIFLAKYNSSGGAVWVRRAGGTNDDSASGVTVDEYGNSYITGYFVGSTTIGNTSFNSYGGNDIFVAKYAANGIFQWARQGGGTGDDEGNSITIDNANYIYVFGTFENSLTFGGSSATSKGDKDVFLVRYTDNGDVHSYEVAGGPNAEEARKVRVDTNKNVYLTGEFYNTTNFGPINLMSSGSGEIFIAKYSGSLTFQWVQKMGGTGSDKVFGLGVDTNGNIYLTGMFYTNATFGSKTFTSSGYTDIFVARVKE
ncbi:SBBP repeat-containing protein [Emticicia sp. C21]|uniref:SBBP repeat-containing protein n=1 Tax=Emticicia sp. C21 TaxID=2302915 RepID=UPI000E7ECCD1|nr:SBBP repeat-containing protein [Emticicia sp. C21]RFS16815.1 hypothetical protein D0T08_09035 [Emticicia sp. C21]